MMNYLEKKADDVKFSGFDSQVQDVLVLCRQFVDVGALLKQQTRNGNMIVRAGQMKRRETVLLADVDGALDLRQVVFVDKPSHVLHVATGARPQEQFAQVVAVDVVRFAQHAHHGFSRDLHGPLAENLVEDGHDGVFGRATKSSAGCGALRQLHHRQVAENVVNDVVRQAAQRKLCE